MTVCNRKIFFYKIQDGKTRVVVLLCESCGFVLQEHSFWSARTMLLRGKNGVFVTPCMSGGYKE